MLGAVSSTCRSSCSRGRRRSVSASTPGRDANAGDWRMIVLTGPAQIAVPPPGQTGSVDYQAELAAIRNAQSRLTRAQRAAIDYWSRGGVLRWNEILMELVADSDLPPAPIQTEVIRRQTPTIRLPIRVPVRQSALCGACLQLRVRRAIRSAEGGVALQVSLQPSRAVAGRRAFARCSRPTVCRVSVGGRGDLWRHRGTAQAAVPDGSREDHAEGGGAASGRAAVREGHGYRHRGGARAGRPSRRCSPRARAPTGCARPADRRRSGRRWPMPRPRGANFVAQHGDAAAAADAPPVWEREGVDDDARGDRSGAAGPPAFHVVTPDGAGTRRGEKGRARA